MGKSKNTKRISEPNPFAEYRNEPVSHEAQEEAKGILNEYKGVNEVRIAEVAKTQVDGCAGCGRVRGHEITCGILNTFARVQYADETERYVEELFARCGL